MHECMPQKRTSQGDFVTRLHQDAITRKEALKKLEEEAREKELSVLKENSLGGKNVSKIVERLTQVRRREPEGKTTFALAGKTQNRDFPSFFWTSLTALFDSESDEHWAWQGSSEKVKEKRLRLQEEAKQKLREATEVRCARTTSMCVLFIGRL